MAATAGLGGWASATTTVDTYNVGTLVSDIWDAETKKAVWRGVASSVVPDDPQKGIKKIDAALDKLVKKWHEMRAKASDVARPDRGTRNSSSASSTARALGSRFRAL